VQEPPGGRRPAGVVTERRDLIMSRRIGEMWIALAIIHFVGVTLGAWDTALDLLDDGVVAGGCGHAERKAFVGWFLMGVPVLTTGVVTRWAQRRTGTVPAALGWTALGCFGPWALTRPHSGATLAAVLAVATIVAARRTTTDAVRRSAAV
jgi:hypothetical protein